MNTAELIRRLAQKFEITNKMSKQMVTFLLTNVVTEVRNGNEVKLSGFGLFYRVKRKARKGRNPQTGEAVAIPAVKIPRFRPGKKFKDAVKK